jgi:biotin carboxylase
MLNGLSEIYQYFRDRETPVYFVSPTAYNLLGIEQWVSSFRYITYFDSFDGDHPRSFTPTHQGPRDFESFESVNTYLLGNKEVTDYVDAHGRGQVLLVMFDAETEELCHELGLEIALPPRELRERIDSKIVTTQLGNEAGVPSVPNVLGKASSYKKLKKLAREAGLGSDLVVQLPYGDSGRTTFFISSREDFDEHKDALVGERLKVMPRIEHFPGTVEACATRHGTLVGPIQTDLTGFPELTPYRGGWAGNDISPDVFDKKTRKRVRKMASRLGDRLYEVGYKGVFCMDFLLDTDTGEVYLGEINPRISGASPMTNLITSTYGGVPLFLFHLLEFADVDWEVDLAAVQQRWLDFDAWSQLVLKQVTDEVELITEAPPSGLWRMKADGEIEFVREETDWHTVRTPDEAFYLRVYGAGEYRYPGADIGVIVTHGGMQADDRELLDRGRAWASAMASRFHGVPPQKAIEPPESLVYTKWF